MTGSTSKTRFRDKSLRYFEGKYKMRAVGVILGCVVALAVIQGGYHIVEAHHKSRNKVHVTDDANQDNQSKHSAALGSFPSSPSSSSSEHGSSPRLIRRLCRNDPERCPRGSNLPPPRLDIFDDESSRKWKKLNVLRDTKIKNMFKLPQQSDYKVIKQKRNKNTGSSKQNDHQRSLPKYTFSIEPAHNKTKIKSVPDKSGHVGLFSTNRPSKWHKSYSDSASRYNSYSDSVLDAIRLCTNTSQCLPDQCCRFSKPAGNLACLPSRNRSEGKRCHKTCDCHTGLVCYRPAVDAKISRPNDTKTTHRVDRERARSNRMAQSRRKPHRTRGQCAHKSDVSARSGFIV